jgi:hypothetical protein
MAIGKPYEGIHPITGENATLQMTAIFGGHRLWHGFSQANSEDNDWKNYDERPFGGYLNDLWIYTKVLDYSEFKNDFRTYIGRWKNLRVKEYCYANPGTSWESRCVYVCVCMCMYVCGCHRKQHKQTMAHGNMFFCCDSHLQ